MKKGIVILFTVLFCVLTSCSEKFGYKHLDGMWQVRNIVYTEGETEQPKDMYFSFQMHIVEVRQLGYGLFNGTFDYTDGIMRLKINGMTDEQAHVFGMENAEQQFVVEKLNSDKLILQSDYARVELRKY